MAAAWISVASLALGSPLKRSSYSGFVENAGDTLRLSLAGKLLQVVQVPPPAGNLYTVRNYR